MKKHPFVMTGTKPTPPLPGTWLVCRDCHARFFRLHLVEGMVDTSRCWECQEEQRQLYIEMVES